LDFFEFFFFFFGLFLFPKLLGLRNPRELFAYVIMEKEGLAQESSLEKVSFYDVICFGLSFESLYLFIHKHFFVISKLGYNFIACFLSLICCSWN
jgi:hypothetical protein